MAIYQGEEMIDVTTPDGRTLTLPRSLVPANMMPQQQIAPQPAGGPLNIPAQETAAPALPPPSEYAPTDNPNVVDSPLSTVEMGEPDTRRVTQQQLAKEQVAQKAAQLKAEKQQAAYNATPQGARENAQKTQDQATADEAKALYNAADLQAAEDETIAKAKEERNVELDKLYAKRNEEAQTNLAAEDAKASEIVALRKKIAGTKIDRGADHPIMLAISAALVGIGQGMMGDKITSYDIITNAIDRKVAAQEADLDRMGKIYGMTKEELQTLKEKSKSRLEFHNTMIAAETDKAVRHIEEITARSASEQTKANAKIIVAQLQSRAADKSAEAMRWGLDFDQKEKHQKQQIGLGYANLAESKRSNLMNEQLKREDMYLDYQKALAADKARGDQETFKARMAEMGEVEKRGLKGLDNDYLLTPQGRAQMEEAKKLEEEAKALESSQGPMTQAQAMRADMLKQKAAVLRGDARTFGVVKARSDTQAGDMSKKYAAAQTMMDTVDEIKMLYDQAGRGYITKDKFQEEMQAKYGLLAVAAKDAWQLGAWDKGSAKLVADIIGQDPTSEWNTGMLGALWNKQAIKDPTGFKNRLEAVTTKLEQDVRSQFAKNSSWDGKGDLFTRKQAPVVSASATKLSQAHSGLEIEKDAEGANVIARGGRRAYQGLVDINAPSIGEEAEGAASSVKYPGLSREQEKPFEDLLTRYTKKNDKRAGEELVGIVADAAVKRPEYVIPLLHNLREHAPTTLYQAARAAVPKDSDVDKQMSYEENMRIGTAPIPADRLGDTVLNSIKDDGTVGDTAGYRELARRAGQGDKFAGKAIAAIVAASGSRKLRMQQDAAQLDAMQRSKGKGMPAGYSPLKGSR